MATKYTNCKEVALRLQTYLDGELDDARMEEIRSHLDACIDCGFEADAFREIKNDLGSLAQPVDSDALARLRDFSARIAAEAAEAN